MKALLNRFNFLFSSNLSIRTKSDKGESATILAVKPFKIAICEFFLVPMILSTMNIMSLLYDFLATMLPFF